MIGLLGVLIIICLISVGIGWMDFLVVLGMFFFVFCDLVFCLVLFEVSMFLLLVYVFMLFVLMGVILNVI